jgi:hypothetical protein
MQPESSDGFASVGTILPEEGAALLPGGSFRFRPQKLRCLVPVRAFSIQVLTQIWVPHPRRVFVFAARVGDRRCQIWVENALARRTWPSLARFQLCTPIPFDFPFRRLYLPGPQRYNRIREQAEVAQLVEQLIRNQQVIGSSPIFGSSLNKRKRRFYLQNHFSRNEKWFCLMAVLWWLLV